MIGHWLVFLLSLAWGFQAEADLVMDLKNPDTVGSASKSLCKTPLVVNHPNGNTALVQCLENGTPHGPVFDFYPDGTIKIIGAFQDGLLQGEWTRFYPNGQKRDQGYWVKGQPDGVWRFWNENGTLRGEPEYDMGTILQPVAHTLEISILAGSSLFLRGGSNSNDTFFCTSGTTGCYSAGASKTALSLQPAGGMLLNYHLWRSWLVELGVFYKSYQFTMTTPYSDNVSPVANSYNQAQTYTQALIAVPILLRFLFGTHFSVGLGCELRAFLNPYQEVKTITSTSGNNTATGGSFNYYPDTISSGLMPTAGVAYRVDLTNGLGLAVDFRTTLDDVQLLAGVTYRLF